MKKTRNFKNEKGITLIVLIIMIMILIILSAVVIKGVTGDNLINTTLSTADEYTIKSYKEQVDAAARNIILKNTAGGRDTSITGITEEMNKTETSWIRKAEKVNEYMIVTVENKCTYQVYYDPVYGVLFTEYIGRDDGKGFPSLNMRYDRAKIMGQVKAESGETIEKVELIYRGVVKQKQDKPSENIEFNAEETGTGWYIIKATSSSGKTIYNWIRVISTSDKLNAPRIVITAEKGSRTESGWYNKESGKITATITANSNSAKGIKYWISTELTNDPNEDGIVVDQKSAQVQISGEGTKRIIAVEIDEKGNESEGRASEIVNIDTIVPIKTVTQKIRGTETDAKLPTSGWYKEDVEVIVDVKDENGSGENGYEYMINNGQETDEESWTKRNKKNKIIFQTEGKNVVVIRGLDVAENHSEEETVTIQLDKTAPDFTKDPTVTEQAATSFKVETQANDNLSGNAENGGEITYTCTVTRSDNKEKVGEIQTNKTGIFNITGLNPKMQYEIRIDVTDPAGNTRSKTVTSATVGKLEKPIITIEEKNQGEKHEEWYTGTVIITIKDPVEENTTGATGISYTIAKITNTGSNLKVLSGTPEGRETKIEFTSAEGEIKVTANMVGLNGGGPIETKTFKRDVTAPDTPSITVGEKTENTIKVTARSSDTISGLASYKFEYSTSSSGPWKTPTNTDKGFKSTLNQNTCDYEYEGLEASTTYYFRVTVTDNAGWSSSNDGKINETTEEAGITPTESMIGKTVAGYNPKLNTTTGTKGGTTNSSGYTPDSQYAGTSSSEPFTTENLGWRIWGLDSNNIYLISATATSATLRLSGAQGYNNGVYILNEICRTCYTDSNYSGVSVRSMNIRDIEELYDKGIMTYNYRSYNEYGASLFSINYPWPTTWTNWDRSTGIPFMSRSIQPNLIESNSQTQPTSYSNPISSYWGHTFADQEGYTNFSDTYLGEVYPNMIFGPPKNLSVDPSFVYWLASRSVNPQSTATCYFQMCKVGGCGVDSATMWFYGKGAQQIRSGMNSVRPIVTIPLTNCKITKSTDGKTDYNISARH